MKMTSLLPLISGMLFGWCLVSVFETPNLLYISGTIFGFLGLYISMKSEEI